LWLISVLFFNTKEIKKLNKKRSLKKKIYPVLLKVNLTTIKAEV